jgi:hypothetical protein
VNMEKNEVYCIPQLKCVEGRVVTHEGFKPGRRPRSRASSARSSAWGSGRRLKSKLVKSTEGMGSPGPQPPAEGAELNDKQARDNKVQLKVKVAHAFRT